MKSRVNPVAMLFAGLGIGAGVMFMLDPASGRRRRALVRDKTTSTVNGAADVVRRRTRDLANRTRGAAASTRRLLERAPVPRVAGG